MPHCSWQRCCIYHLSQASTCSRCLTNHASLLLAKGSSSPSLSDFEGSEWVSVAMQGWMHAAQWATPPDFRQWIEPSLWATPPGFRQWMRAITVQATPPGFRQWMKPSLQATPPGFRQWMKPSLQATPPGFRQWMKPSLQATPPGFRQWMKPSLWLLHQSSGSEWSQPCGLLHQASEGEWSHEAITVGYSTRFQAVNEATCVGSGFRGMLVLWFGKVPLLSSLQWIEQQGQTHHQIWVWPNSVQSIQRGELYKNIYIKELGTNLLKGVKWSWPYHTHTSLKSGRFEG